MASVYFAGGGSGGHLFPGIAVAEELQRQRPDVRIAFLCRADRVEQERIRAAGFRAVPVRSGRLSRFPWRMARSALALAWGTVSSALRMRRERPAFVVGLGGYAAAPTLAAARWIGCPILLLEQNLIPGKVNRWFASRAEAVFVPWPECAAHLQDPSKALPLGNPIRRAIAQARREPLAEAWWGGRGETLTLLVLGGSQGSLFINDLMIHLAPRLARLPGPLRVIHLSGASRRRELEDAYRKSEIPAEVHEFRSDMASVYAQSDVVLCRAGGTTLAELAAMGLPALLVPLPTAAEDHQRLNAGVVEKAGAAVAIPQGAGTADRVLEQLERLLRSRDVYLTMEKNARTLGKPEAARNVAEWISARLPA